MRSSLERSKSAKSRAERARERSSHSSRKEPNIYASKQRYKHSYFKYNQE